VLEVLEDRKHQSVSQKRAIWECEERHGGKSPGEIELDRDLTAEAWQPPIIGRILCQKHPGQDKMVAQSYTCLAGEDLREMGCRELE
jgi:hypothetical protein